MYATLTIAVALVVFFLQLTMIGNIIYDGLPEEEYFLRCDEEAVVDEGEPACRPVERTAVAATASRAIPT